jgi:indoleacetate decarboxylase
VTVVLSPSPTAEEREVSGKPSTERVLRRYRALLDEEPCIDSQRARLHTDYIRDHWQDPPASRAGGALRHVLSNLTPRIWDGELLVGNTSRYFQGTQVYPEYEPWMLEAIERVQREEERYIEGTLQKRSGDRLGIYLLPPEDREEILEAARFWRGRDWRSTAERVLRASKPEFSQVERWMQQLVFLRFMYDVPEGRVIVDYGRAIDHGLLALLDEVNERRAALGPLDSRDKLDRYDFYCGVESSLQGVLTFAAAHAAEAERQAAACTDPQRRAELLELARICRKVPGQRAETFHEALQSFWFVHVCLFIELNGRGISPGRFDQYMLRPYLADRAAGRGSREQALELLELLRIKCSEITRAHATFTESYLGGSVYQNLTLGGVDAEGRPAENELSELVLEAGINVKTWQPTLSVRWRPEMSASFKAQVVRCIKAGSGYPALFGDDLAIERLQRVSGASLEDARDWAPCGCVDMQICGKRMPMYAVPHTNNLKLLELVLNRGVNPVTGDKLLEISIDPELCSFEELVAEYEGVMELVVQREEEHWNTIMLVHNQLGLLHPFMSALLDDCLDRGLDAYQGGCRYNEPAYVIACGMVNVANSLAALRQVVYQEKHATMGEVLAALKANFEGHDRLRRRLLEAPKYGNDDDRVDSIVSDLYAAWGRAAEANLNWLGEPWRPSTLSVTTQVLHGKACGASPDGRRAGEALADGALSAYPGTDLCGPTAMLKSAAKVDARRLQSTLLNLKFNPSAIEGDLGAAKFIRLNDTYFGLGGYHVQYNVVDRRMLLDAQEHPERYKDLLVRVAGFTARFVDLGPDVQKQIIDRTQFGADDTEGAP